MSFAILVDAVKFANLSGVRLAVKDRQRAREYWSHAIQHYHEMMGYGLPGSDPSEFLYHEGWAVGSRNDRVELPLALPAEGGTRLDELFVLGTATRLLRPSKVFEIGTFMGRTTSVFVLNAPRGASVITLDLPPDSVPDAAAGRMFIDSDLALIRHRRVGSALHDLQLDGRYEQVLCDSMRFDPTPHARSVELGFIDGAHTREYVENDTRKMAMMMADRGLVFWHDYGGRGRFRPLTEYLESLAQSIAIYRVPNTTLAWSTASEVRRLIAR